MRSINPRTGTEMTPNETIIYDALCEAAAAGKVCPNYLDLAELIGADSSSTSPAIVTRLIQRGLIRGERYTRSRDIQIVATGEWTKSDPMRKSDTPQNPRGTHDARPLLKALDDICIPADVAAGMVDDFRSLLRLEKRLTRALELIQRRKNGMLLSSRDEAA